ncbi:hypothetical protein Clacol_002735 [Clathrus columnatus]|uniref:DH domain-containing protein n=1 Tax=Clathrus columnatus TaxID=1419009 RepID=A0AAV5A4X4_9AGAM|nr:hypothetical protein Clacol_002735 [Clathrus columnatus]
MAMLSVASPLPDEASQRPLSPASPPNLRSRRYALLPPLPPPTPEPPSSPPVPARSPLRLSHRKSTDAPPISSQDSTSSKRKHALLELLSSERSYASDLALIREVHIPRALGLPISLLSLNGTLPSSTDNTNPPPMSKEDVKIIFGNVEDLGVFSETFCEKLEEALKGVSEPDGNGQDTVAETFISIIPYIKLHYTTYITRHSSALSHLNSLPQTPALTAYLAETHTLAQSYTHAWDLPSLLIKPVQRLLKYPLLLSAIIDDTPSGEARDKLCLARDKVEEVARSVNEGRRRLEVVKNILNEKHPPIRLKSIKGLKYKVISKHGGQIDALENRLYECERFVQDFAKTVTDWSTCTRGCISHLETWSIAFGRIIGLDRPHASEALNLFTEIISSQIMPIWASLDMAIQSVLLPKLSRLLATIRQPSRLLEHLHALRPQHLQLLDTPISKQRPPNSLVEASQSYSALEIQLRAELPQYIRLFERGLLACIAQLADWQALFWKEVRAQWVELWDALGVEGDMSAGVIETVKLWWERWEEVQRTASQLQILKYTRRDKNSSFSPIGTGPTATLATTFVSGPVPPSPSSSSIYHNHRPSMHSIEFELDTLLHHVSQGFTPIERVASPDGYSIKRKGSGVSMSTKASTKRKDTDLSRRNSSDKSTARRGNERRSPEESGTFQSRRPSTAHTDGDRSSVSRQTQDSSISGLFTKMSIESATSYAQPSPRDSVHTTSSTSSNHRLSMRSIDAHVGMDATYLPEASPQTSSSSSLNKKIQQYVREQGLESRTQLTKSPSLKKRLADAFKSPNKRSSRQTTKTTHSLGDYIPISPIVIDIASSAVVLYNCTVVHPFSIEGHNLPLYRGKPFLTLEVGDSLDILSEEGHPREHEDLPVRAEDENCEDCLLLAKDANGLVGWALASFLIISP